jgi:methionyl-tRNA formyltransferase
VIIHRSLVESVDNVSPAPGEILVAHDDALVVAAGVGSVRVLALQLDGRRLTDARSFINGAHVHAGDRFTAVPAGH